MFPTERRSLFNQTFLHWQDTLPEINTCSLFPSYTFFLLWMQPGVHALVQLTPGHAGWNPCRVEGLEHCNVLQVSPLHWHAAVTGADQSPSWSGSDGCYGTQKPIRCTGGPSLDHLRKALLSKRWGRFSSLSTLDFSGYWATCVNM